MESDRMPVHLSKRGFLLLLTLQLFFGVKALKDVAVTIPPAARIMDTVTLQCKYDLEGEPLYTVKWYKGSKEFYRYIPKEHPNTQVFPLPGIDVDLSKSTPSEVVLRNVQPEVTGRYKCEVSTDAPNFYTHIVSGYMYVIDVPVDDPELSVEKELLEIGYTIKGNCTSPASYPSTNLTWYLNGRKLNESNQKRISVDPHTMAFNNRRTPVITVSRLELEIDGNTFQRGKARLSCVATVFNLYKREKEIILEEERPRPRPSSVLGTRDAASDSPTFSAKVITTTLLVIIPLLR